MPYFSHTVPVSNCYAMHMHYLDTGTVHAGDLCADIGTLFPFRSHAEVKMQQLLYHKLRHATELDHERDFAIAPCMSTLKIFVPYTVLPYKLM